MEQNNKKQAVWVSGHSDRSFFYIVFGVILVPLIILVFLYNAQFAHTPLVYPVLHSFILSILCAVAFYTSYSAYTAFIRTREVQLFFLSLAFIIFGVGFLVHTASVPGYIFAEAFFDVTEHASLFFGSLAVMFLWLPIYGTGDFVYRRRVPTLVFSVVALLIYFTLVLLSEDVAKFSKEYINTLFVLPTIVFFSISTILFARKYYNNKTILAAYLVVGFLFLTEVSIVPVFYMEWSALWWFFHTLALFGFGTILVGVLSASKSGEAMLETFKTVPVRYKISTKFTALTIVLAIVPAVSIMFTSLTIFGSNIEKQTIEDIVLVGESKEGHLFSFIEGIMGRVVNYSSDGYIRNLAKRIVSGDKSPVVAAELGKYLVVNKMALDKTIYAINIVDLNGIVIASTDSAEIGKDETRDDYFISALKLPFGVAHVTDISLGEHSKSGEHSIVSSASLFDLETGKRIGVVANYYSTYHLDDILTGRQQVRLGALSGIGGKRDTLDIYLVNKDKLMITESRFLGKETFMEQVVDTDPVRSCVEKKKEMSGSWVDYRGKKVYGSSMCITNYGYDWTLVVQVDEVEVLQAVETTKGLFITFILPLFVIIILFGVYFSRRFTESIESLTKTAEIISGGNLSARAKIDTRDEIGVLAGTFNRMAETIEQVQLEVRQRSEELAAQNRELEEAKVELEEAKVGLEEKVKERTIELEKAKASLEVQVAERTQALQMSNASLEEEVVRRTAELQAKLMELGRFNRVAVGRELKMVELKEEIARLKSVIDSKNVG